MNNCIFKVFEEIEQESSSNEKMDILKKYLLAFRDEIGQTDVRGSAILLILDWVFNYQHLFYVKQIPEPVTNGSFDDTTVFYDFKMLAIKLMSGTIRGKNATEQIMRFLMECDPIQKKWFVRILQKNLRCGLQITSVNKVLQQVYHTHVIPTFELCLCAPEKSLAKKFPLVAKDWYIEPKLDGARMIYDSSTDKFWSRQGKELLNFDFLKEDIKRLLVTQISQEGFIVDGEVIYTGDKDSYEGLMENLKVKNRDTSDEIGFVIFDLLTLDEWNERKVNRKYHERRSYLKKLFGDSLKFGKLMLNYSHSLYSKIRPEQQKVNLEDVHHLMMDFSDQGYEGLVLKHAESVYEFDRSKYWVKFKPVEEADVVVKRIELGDPLGRHANSVGALVFDFGNREMRCGGGLSDDQRIYWYLNPNEIIGKTIEVRFDKQTGKGGTRFPRLVRVREDK